MDESGSFESYLMNILSRVADWFSASEHWTGSTGVPVRIFEHLQMSFGAVALAAAIALPLGLMIGHTRRGSFIAISVANLGRAIPSFAILAISVPFFGIGFKPTLITLVALAIPPILTNTYVGVEGVDADTVEAARGMGMAGRQILTRIELPLAVPLMLTGLRTAAVQVVATATLAALIGWGGLGRFIIDGFATGKREEVLAGAILVALLAIVTEVAFGVMERLLSPRLSSDPRHVFRAFRHAGQVPRPGADAGV
jgi:osmoprotectant transport system permease protein